LKIPENGRFCVALPVVPFPPIIRADKEEVVATRKPRIDKVVAANGRAVKTKIPTGEAAEEELRRIRRQARRRVRAAKNRGEEPTKRDVEDILGESLGSLDNPADPLDPVEMGVPTPEQLRSQFWGAFGALGGQAGLVAWGRRYPKEFYTVWARVCIPKTLGGGPPANSLEEMLASLGDDE